jgi:aspartyl-tRNA(Asn)/glutamyl-tRNA(Gln) amidotransferase subunit A
VTAPTATDWTATALADALAAGTLSADEATRACLDRIARLDGRLRAFITVDAEGALARARSLDAARAGGRLCGPLHGVPVAHKDLCRIGGLPTSCGTRTAQYLATGPECTAAARLEAAGAVLLGKLNMSELALGAFGDNPHHGDPQNPWRPGHAAGGSSSGSAVAVAAGLALGALGTDTGGSIRLPAACCGVVGLKPTYGRVSRAGVMPLSWSLDHVGPLARTVADVALLLEVIAGPDPLDATSSGRAVEDYRAALRAPVRGLRLGLVENYYFEGVDGEMAEAARAAARALEAAGVRVTPLRVPDPQEVVDVCTVISTCEAAAVHARLVRERPEELGPVARARLEIGFHVSAHDYLQALRLRARLARTFLREGLVQVDALLAPVIPEPAPPLAAVTTGPVGQRLRASARFSRLTRPWNGLGLPALALPAGRSADGRPLAIQLIGRPFAEATLLRLGQAWEEAAGAAVGRPALD